MSYKKLPLSALVVNPNNDRHGEQGSEQRAIAWLLNNRASHMRNLAKDIVVSGQVFEPPLVYPEGNKFLVADGNRRVTTLKLLNNPKLAPTKALEDFYQRLALDWSTGIPKTILCQVESDRDAVDEILFRRHTGAQGGVGQSTWDDRAKFNFEERTGKRTKIDVANEISKFLSANGYASEAEKLPRSNLNRLLSSEPMRAKVGITTKGGRFQITHNQASVIKALKKISSDLISRKITLNDVWDNEGKRKYLNGLEGAGHLPTHTDLLEVPTKPTKTPAAGNPASHASASSTPSSPTLRVGLIPRDIAYDIVWSGDTARQRDIWHELQHTLEYNVHANAIGVLFRVLLELSILNYNKKSPCGIHDNDSLSNRVIKTASVLRKQNSIDEKHFRELKKFAQDEQLISAQTMNSYVHSVRFTPSAEHLSAMWTSLAPFLVLCLNT